MGFYAYLEILNNGKFPIVRENGVNVGTPLEAFIAVYMNYKEFDKGSLELSWFKKFEELSSINLRKICWITYAGEWDYSFHEYEKFVTDQDPARAISEAEFKEMIETIEKTWSPLDEILQVVTEIVRILPIMGGDTYWFSQNYTINAFRALYIILNDAAKQGAKSVRIQLL